MLKYREHLRETRRAYFRALLHEAHGSITQAARIAGMNRGYVYRMLEKLGMPLMTPQNTGNRAWESLQ